MYWQSPKTVLEIKVRLKLPKKINCVGNLGFVKHNINENSGRSVVRKSWSFTKSYLLFPVAVQSCWHHVPAQAICKKSSGFSILFWHKHNNFCSLLLVFCCPAFLHCSWCLRAARQPLQVSHSTPSFLFSYGSRVQLAIKPSSIQGAWAVCDPFLRHKVPWKDLCGSKVGKYSTSPRTALHAFPLESNLQGNEVRDGDADGNSK